MDNISVPQSGNWCEQHQEQSRLGGDAAAGRVYAAVRKSESCHAVYTCRALVSTPARLFTISKRRKLEVVVDFWLLVLTTRKIRYFIQEHDES